MPILGIWASQISGKLWAPAGAYESIATTTVGAGGSSSITFSSIPSTYTHLQIRVMAIGSAAEGYMRFNSDTGSNYSYHVLYGNGSSAGATSSTSTTRVLGTGFAAGASSATNPYVTVIDILDYANTNKYKTTRALDGQDLNGSGIIDLNSGLWQSTSAITTVNLFCNSGSYNQYSSFALYGIKG